MKKILSVVMVLILLPLVCADWNMFMHDEEHTGFSDIDVGTVNTEIWNVNLTGKIYSSPAVVENTVYIGTSKYLYALDLNGNELWKKKMSIFGSSPTVVNNRIYIGTMKGYVYCLDTEGNTIWKIETNKDITASPIVYKGKVFIGSWNSLFYCLDAETGDINWKYVAKMAVKTSAAVWNERIFIVLQNEFYRDELHCIDLDGNRVWMYETAHIPKGSCPPGMSSQFITSSPTIYNDRVYFGSGKKKIYCLDCKTGEPFWEFKTEASELMEEHAEGDRIISTLSVASGKVYFGSWNNKVYCLDANSGTEEWTFPTGGTVISSPAISDGIVHIGCLDGRFYCLEATNGNLLGGFETGNVIGAPAISNSYVFVPGSSKLYCLGEKGGSASTEKKETQPAEKHGDQEKKNNKIYYIIAAVIGIVLLIAVGMKRR
ncbi:MAG: PQQ-binding-like beta-propeller repeat protein [Euryarchaeota archaeon]|nr:PQQ-binding-like beta-propeller repeat protein [Euryarchaeota archaeon]